MEELIPGSKVYLHRDEMHGARNKIKQQERKSTRSPSKKTRDGKPCARYLMSVFFTRREMLTCCLSETSNDAKQALNPVIVNAILCKCFLCFEHIVYTNQLICFQSLI